MGGRGTRAKEKERVERRRKRTIKLEQCSNFLVLFLCHKIRRDNKEVVTKKKKSLSVRSSLIKRSIPASNQETKGTVQNPSQKSSSAM